MSGMGVAEDSHVPAPAHQARRAEHTALGASEGALGAVTAALSLYALTGMTLGGASGGLLDGTSR